MAQYRFLQDAYVNGGYFQAGLVTAMPPDWIPGPYVEPLDDEAVQAFFKAGPQLMGLQRQRWFGVPMPVPVTYWKPADRQREYWQLTGLGAHLGAAKWTSDSDRSNPTETVN
jgi:hypothetical protein